LEKNGSSFNEWTRNHVWFRSHYQRLARSYDRQNIAVYQTKVIDHDKNLTRLLNRVKKNYPEDRVVVEYVSRGKRELVLRGSERLLTSAGLWARKLYLFTI
jgi:hypothetical protein